ncbi:MAG: hypothetical protein WCE45_01105 [Sedimentisphaerales bacterium]
MDLISPGENAEMSFDSSDSGNLEIAIEISISSGNVSTGDISVDCDNIGDSVKSIGPVTKEGNIYKVTITYAGLPTNNSDFGYKTIKIRYKGIEIGKRKIKVFFPKYGKNHPGEGSGETPNWYYYWKQTNAHYGNCQYDEPADPKLQGGYTDWDAPNYTSYVCQDTPIHYTPGSPSDNNEVPLDGIDTFAWTCRHEWRHHISLLAWWGAGGYVAAQDIDRDLIPDNLENGFTVADGGPFDPNKYDTYDQDWPPNDDERYTVVTQDHWQKGSADNEDWANPGHQSQ